MRNNLIKITLAASFWLAMVFTISCEAASNPSALVGHWLYLDGSRDSKKPERSIELFKDGTGVVDGNTISWKTENKRLILLASFIGITCDYKVSGSKLTLIYDEGDSAVFVKKADYEKEKKKMEAEAEAKREKAERKKAAALKAKFDEVKKGSFTDSRDGKAYRTIKFDNQTWMAENLGYNAEGSKCYENSESNCQKYGKLYNWETALKACPKGWHLPSIAEWETLVDLAGGGDEAGNILKSASGWESNGNGVDAVGFSALPGGASGGGFILVGKNGIWWSATEDGASNARGRSISYNSTEVTRLNDVKTLLLSVRCVQD